VRRISALLLPIALCAARPAAAQTALVPQISGNSVTAKIQLAGGVEADLSITFEQVVGLNSNALALSAALVNPMDATLLSRMPDPTSFSIPAGFPVLVRIDPASSSGLSFSGASRVSLYTHNLTLTANSPLRLYTAHGGGAFHDMTGSLDPGSVRAGGSTDGYSEFLIVADVRSVNTVIPAKFDALQATLSANASSMSAAVAADLQQRLTNARNLYQSGAVSSAIDAVAAFGDQVKQQSGANIPDVWQANGALVNVAGLLRSGADTLKFSLTCKSNGAP
jgi:hypothetical protein